ncbi:LLM class flavin-dependent oxidoreductase [Nakamurella leprariae]|uniref:LLM class flavin-dependent oxidoreductase n=1 Tax=Nakamurella leprariae TaxID=2803911 RepID=A0A938YBE0_9ACTN|nr:LLM class flavin-dependent oxidoreductase [Nakamurella leprariae]MBM9466699.1 LLM class flavin-dependent oxidoreductase [Nakamurella leprariae]
MPTDQLHVGIEVDGAGAHPAAWRIDPDAARDALGGAGIRRAVAAAENGGATFVTIDDSLTPPATGPATRLDAVVRAAFVAPTTSRLGLVPLVHPATVEPFHLASQLGGLDHATAGRAGWLVGAGPVPGARRALDRPVAEGADLLAETADVIEVVRALWDSWEDDAVIRDTATGRYIDRDRLHAVDFVSGGTGATAGPALRTVPDGVRAPFSVKGPSIVPRSPQGHAVVFAREGTVPAGAADVVLVGFNADRPTAAPDVTGAATVLDLPVTLDTPAATAAQRRADLDGLASDGAGAGFVGSAGDLVELLRGLRGVVTGVRILPSVLWTDLPIVVRDVLPALRVDRAVPIPRPGATLRDTLGLGRPANLFAASGSTR